MKIDLEDVGTVIGESVDGIVLKLGALVEFQLPRN
jgi:hypothetical protein